MSHPFLMVAVSTVDWSYLTIWRCFAQLEIIEWGSCRDDWNQPADWLGLMAGALDGGEGGIELSLTDPMLAFTLNEIALVS